MRVSSRLLLHRKAAEYVPPPPKTDNHSPQRVKIESWVKNGALGSQWTTSTALCKRRLLFSSSAGQENTLTRSQRREAFQHQNRGPSFCRVAPGPPRASWWGQQKQKKRKVTGGSIFTWNVVGFATLEKWKLLVPAFRAGDEDYFPLFKKKNRSSPRVGSAIGYVQRSELHRVEIFGVVWNPS